MKSKLICIKEIGSLKIGDYVDFFDLYIWTTISGESIKISDYSITLEKLRESRLNKILNE